MGIKITFEGRDVAEIICEMSDFMSKAADQFHQTGETTKEVNLPAGLDVALKAARKTKPKKETPKVEEPKAEEPDSLGEDPSPEVTVEDKPYDLEKDIIPAFQAYKAKVEAKLGKEKALAQCKNILAKFSCKSVRELNPVQYGEVLKWVQ